MKQISYTFDSTDALQDIILDGSLLDAVSVSRSSLITLLTGENAQHQLLTYATLLKGQFPNTPVVGASTCGEINHGDVVVHSATIIILLFDFTDVVPIFRPFPEGEEEAAARGLRTSLDELNPAAVLMLNTPLSYDASIFNRFFSEAPVTYDVFGGGAGDYAMQQNFVLLDHEISKSAVVAIAFIGEQLQVIQDSFVGWRPMSKQMQITGATGRMLQTIDHQPAADIYRKYLSIGDDSDFFSNALGFPMLIGDGENILARVPIQVTSDSGLLFISDFENISNFRLGFIDPEVIDKLLENIYKQFQAFSPEGILVFSCACRRFVLLDDVKKETLPLSEIAPTSGFFSVGEVCNSEPSDLVVKNLSFVAVGLREGPVSETFKPEIKTGATIPEDIYQSSPSTVIQRLIYFIDNLNTELSEKNTTLKQQNEKLRSLSVTDCLTGLFNRQRLDDMLEHELNRAFRMNYRYSIILLDIDYFKTINDSFGHQTGDLVLKDIAHLLLKHTRETDVVGRWGGEEFMVVCPGTGIRGAHTLAENLRKAINAYDFPEAGHISASFGVGEYCAEDSIDSLLTRVDKAMYSAKHNGRNRVELADLLE